MRLEFQKLNLKLTAYHANHLEKVAITISFKLIVVLEFRF